MTDKIQPTKTAKDEDFPVGSFLIPKHLRKHVMFFYDYARTGDDIADSSELSSDEKLKRLQELEDVLLGVKEPDDQTLCAKKLQESLKEWGGTTQHAIDLYKAFKHDSIGIECKTWEDLIAYCYNSAGSVGRFMLDLHQENPSCYWPSNAICAALQINNHLTDCKEDFLEKQRVYLPTDWLAESNATVEMLSSDKTTPEMQAVFDKTIMGIQSLLVEGSSLPLVLVNRGLRMEVCFIYRLAQRLVKRLKKGDILKQKVKLKKIDWFFAFIIGVLGGIQRKKIKCVNKKLLKNKKKKSQNKSNKS